MSNGLNIFTGAWNRTGNARIVMRKELRSYFVSPIAYIVITLFLVIAGIIIFPAFFLKDRAELRGFFEILPILLSIFVPALTMRLFSEEHSTGTFEMMMTMPLSLGDIVAGKILAATVFISLMLVPTLVYPLTIMSVGSLDFAPVFGGYLGAVILGAAYASIGVFVSALTKNQVVALISGLSICLFLTLVDKFLVFFPARVVSIFEYIGADYHFRSISKGVIDTRDIIYFASVILLAALGTMKVIERRR
jgi:ABC-2 type transport system permease protein